VRDTTDIWAGIIGLIIVAIIATCSAGPNYLGWNQSAAEKNAAEWSREMGIDLDRAVCNARDTDDDGYISCTFHVGDSIETFECAGFTYVMPHSGCREPKIKIPARR
jgi:hypothetical protein